MNKSNWKGFERDISALFGTTRTPLSGGNSKHTRSDTLHKKLFFEAKKRKTHSVITLWKETKKLADKEGKIPVVALRAGDTRGIFLLIEVNDLIAVVRELEFGLKEYEHVKN